VQEEEEHLLDFQDDGTLEEDSLKHLKKHFEDRQEEGLNGHYAKDFWPALQESMEELSKNFEKPDQDFHLKVNSLYRPEDHLTIDADLMPRKDLLGVRVLSKGCYFPRPKTSEDLNFWV